jgi:hypothetical protein
MSSVLDIILDEGNATRRDGVAYCIKLKGQLLDGIIGDQKILETLLSIGDGQNTRASEVMLDEWQQKITQELDTYNPLIEKEDCLHSYIQSKGIILQTLLHDFFDYTLLQDEHLSKQINEWHKKHAFNRRPSDNILELIGDVYSIKSTNLLLLLYAHYLYEAVPTVFDETHKQNILLTAIKHRLYDLSKINNFSFKDLHKKFPYFDVLTKKVEIRAFDELCSKLQYPVSSGEWSSVVKFFTHCQLNTVTYPILKGLIHRANETSNSAIAESLKKILAKHIIEQELATYERIVSGRKGKRQSPQRNESLQQVKQAISQPLDEMDIKDLKKLLEQHIKDTLVDHKKSRFSWLTNSNLVQAYKKALLSIDKNLLAPDIKLTEQNNPSRPLSGHSRGANNVPPPSSLRSSGDYYNLEKKSAKNIILEEIAAYENKVSRRIGKRQSMQRRESIHSVKVSLGRLYEYELDIQDSIKLLKDNIKQALVDHKKSWFSWFTNSNLAQAYQRALSRIISSGRGGDNGSTFNNFPPPPPPAAGAVICQIQNEGSFWRRNTQSFSSVRVRAREIQQAEIAAMSMQNNQTEQTSFAQTIRRLQTSAAVMVSSLVRRTPTMFGGSAY